MPTDAGSLGEPALPTSTWGLSTSALVAVLDSRIWADHPGASIVPPLVLLFPSLQTVDFVYQLLATMHHRPTGDVYSSLILTLTLTLRYDLDHVLCLLI